MEVYSDVPGARDTKLLAAIPFDGRSATARFDVETGTENVYVRVLDNNKLVRYASRVSVAGSRTNGEEEADSEIFGVENPSNLIVNDFESTTYRMPANTLDYLWSNKDKISGYDEAAIRYSEETGQNLQTFKDAVKIPNLYKIDNLKNVYGQELYWKELKPMFHEYEEKDGSKQPGAFAEGVDHIDQYFLNPKGSLKLNPDVTFNVLKDGPVTMQCIWRGTQYSDYFGYYYFPKGKDLTPEELWNLPKYIFITPEEITEDSDLTQVAMHTIKSHSIWNPDTQENELIIDGEEWGEWTDLGGMSNANNPYWEETDNRKFRGKEYSLAYFGENYDQPASYDFPAGIQIGYFLIRDGSTDLIFFSDCELNYYLNYEKYYGQNGSVAGGIDGPLARPFAAKYTFDNRTYVGFGDLSGDCDLNDVVFIAENVFPTPEDITPEAIKPKPQTWTLACEDLGSTDDFDFNDIVIDIEYVAGSEEITFKPRAAGGILDSEIYFDGNKLGEIHDMLNSQSGMMINTGIKHVDPATVKPVTIPVGKDWTMTQAEGGFSQLFRIYTTNPAAGSGGNDGYWLESVKSLADNIVVPQMLLLRNGWEWPKERVDIKDAYPNFTEWVRDDTDFDWDSQKVKGNVMNIR